MKRMFGIAAVAGLLAAAPAFAGVDVFVQFGTPAPVYATPAPVLFAPAAYYHQVPSWHGHRGFQHGHRDYRDRRWHHDHRGRR
jgi:hypothetical protein